LIDEYADYRLNVISEEEYDEEYPIRTIYTKGEYMMKFEEALLEGWEPWCAGNYDLPAKNVTLKDGTKGCVIIDNEGIAVYSLPLETVNDDDMGAVFVEIAEQAEEVDQKLGNYVQENVRKEAKIVFKNYLKHQKSLHYTK